MDESEGSVKAAIADGSVHTVYFAGPVKLEFWKNTRDVYPMFWIYPRPPQHAVQFTIWRYRCEIRWRKT